MKDQNILIQNGVDLVKGLELFGDMEMYNESLGDFMAEVNDKLFKISRFKEMNDMPNYAILVHSLKSDAKYFGFTHLAELSYAHELESKANNTVFVNENYNALVEEANRIIAVVRQYLASTGNGGGVPFPQPAIPVAPTPIPLVQNPIPASAPIAAVPIYQSTVSNLTSILVVDDSDIIMNFVKKIFVGSYNVLTASDGGEAINLINNTNNISAMLLDLNMPNVDGFKVLAYMKERDLFKTLPVSIITGNDSREIDFSAFEYPIVDILKKPFNDASVKSIVERTINHRI